MVIIDNNKERKGCDIINNNQFVEDYKKYINNNSLEFEKIIRNIFNDSSDLVIRSVVNNNYTYFIVYIDGMVNKDLLDRDIIKSINYMDKKDTIKNVIQISQLKVEDISLDFVDDVLNGDVIIFSSKEHKIFICDLKGWNQRALETPDSEVVVRGPKESFTETLRVNTSLIRRKIKNPNLVFESIILGKQTNTTIAICYIEGIVNKEVLKELKIRLSKIKVDSILETGCIEQYVEDNSRLPMPTVGSTQKPDVAAAKILEGRVAVICDGTPHVMTVPHLFIENLQTSEDYYQRPILSAFLRVIRLEAVMISVLLPGVYVAVTTYHQEMIPSVLLRTIASAVSIVPFPRGAEALIMLLIFEILRESGTRLPRNVGSAVSIMGAIVIGQAAVDAGIVGAPMVIIIALTALSSFVVPILTEFMITYRLLFLLFGSTMGLIGVCSLLMILLAQLLSAESFGVPYTTIRNSNGKIKDFIIRSSLKKMNYRPYLIAKENVKRQEV